MGYFFYFLNHIEGFSLGLIYNTVILKMGKSDLLELLIKK